MKEMASPEKRVQKVFPKAILADGTAVAGSSQCDPSRKQVLLKIVNNFNIFNKIENLEPKMK